MDTVSISGKRLQVSFFLPPEPRTSQRFDAGGVVSEVVLDGRHTFCVPEQLLPGRVTTFGVGLCGEFVTPGIASLAGEGEPFPKFGVGLLTQRPEGGEHNVWKTYPVRPFETHWEKGDGFVTFVSEPLPAMGYAARTTKTYRLEENRLVLETTFENTGEKPISLGEYQHNFVCVDHIPAGEGYVLSLPFNRKIGELAEAFETREGAVPCPGTAVAQGQDLVWKGDMEGKTYIQVLEGPDIAPVDGPYWTLSHKASPAFVSESLSFVPQRAVLWGIEHCICTELYFKQDVLPGETASWRRTWTFSD